MDRDFKGIWIPKEIWLNKELSMVDKGIFAEINSLDNEGHCTASNEYLAEFCGVSESTITRSIKKLSELTLITVDMCSTESGSIRIIKINMGYRQFDERGVVNLTRPVSSNCLSSNIYNNINILSKDNINNNINNNTETDYDGHGYSTKDFIGSIKKKPRQKKETLYDRCVNAIYTFTKDGRLIDALLKYLDVRLANKDKPLYNINQWNAILKKLDTFEDKVEIVEQSTENGWASFFPLKSMTTTKTKNTFAENNKVSSTHNTKTDDERRKELEDAGEEVICY